MTAITRTFTAGRMNKDLDERLVPNGEYIEALNCRLDSTDEGGVQNVIGNTQLTTLQYNGSPLVDAVTIGKLEDGAHERIFWFVHANIDMIVSFNTSTETLTYHVADNILNFNPDYPVLSVNIVNNLLFFNDNYNPPRMINVDSIYTNITAEALLVIKKPPLTPSIEQVHTVTEDTFLQTRFICFAYRYRYADNMYSATSQFSMPCFTPSPFEFDINSYQNKGMDNMTNTAVITYNSGNNLVVGVDLLFKEMGSNIIKVIEKLDKKTLGLVDNTDYTYSFTNSKIFTVLPDYELLRLYDNIPLKAGAQTIMGNRLVLGNYEEGYDMTDADGNNVKLEYQASLVQKTVGVNTIPYALSSGTYSVDGAKTITGAVVSIDLTGISLVKGSAIIIDLRIIHSAWSGSTPPSETTQNTNLSFTFLLTKDYSSVYQMATSIEFQNAVGVTIKPVSTSCDGGTFTDQFNCALPGSLGTLNKDASGITAIGQPIAVITSPASSQIGFQMLAMRYTSVFEYYTIDFVSVTQETVASPKSLHSNRGYEVGIIYQDDYARATTALVSPNDTIHIPCSASDTMNSVRITIPVTQKPPAWASRYKFVIKPDTENYEIIYSQIFFKDPKSNATYFLLEGENSQKVQIGDRLLVKRDTLGINSSCTYCTVLDKQAQIESFLQVPIPNTNPVLYEFNPQGVYMKINANSFSTDKDINAVIDGGMLTYYRDAPGTYSVMRYPFGIKNEYTGLYDDFTVPAGSIIKFYWKFQRLGVTGIISTCPRRIYTLDLNLVASVDYANIYDWFIGDNIALAITTGIQEIGAGTGDILNSFHTGIDPNGNDFSDVLSPLNTNYWKFYRDPATHLLYLRATGTLRCSGIHGIFTGNSLDRRTSIMAEVVVVRTDATLIFETEPTDALPDLFWENDESFAIEGGFHKGNVQDQSGSVPAIIDCSFFNCFCFGNGVESYKIFDSMSGNALALGNRVTSTSAQDYKRAIRFADLTYSGIYNDESNLNKFNEFNLGLLNFKTLEKSFGVVRVIDGRQTDILVLQEDKISYVLAGKNLLSDAGAGNTLTSVPEVLGTQLARVEKYGISNNPESYVVWGFNRFFTDAKRGVVLQLKGGSYSTDQLIPISMAGMKTWFRDLFNSAFNTQKIGGFDPFNDEYILSSNNNVIPNVNPIINCGSTFSLKGTNNYTVNFGSVVGLVTITYTVLSGSVDIVATYGETTVSVEDATESGTLTFEKDSLTDNTVDLSVSGDVEVTVSCPATIPMNVVFICVTGNEDAGKIIHDEFRYTDGSFTSPLQSTMVKFLSGSDSPLVSLNNLIAGVVGDGICPTAGSTVRLASNKISFDTYDFDPTNKFRYLVSDSHITDVQTILNSSTILTNVLSAGYNFAEFAMPVPKNYLYLIYDYRKPNAIELCFGDTAADACCSCEPNPYYDAYYDYDYYD